ncbi:MAG TPA: proton-conducting transporter membrane subunit, partial [Saprospiraceae bacterium]|nr:proton-conducting transporter membrane subunit [Saprospiraceae bacterium]
MSVLISLFLITLGSAILVATSRDQWKGNVALMGVLLNVAVSSYLSISVLVGDPYEFVFDGGNVFGQIAFRIDALSSWFMLLMNFTVLTGILYGRRYMLHYEHQSSNLTLHFVSYLINHMAMIGIYGFQNSFAFLCAWEIMAITSFLLIIFEHHKMETLKAGINYLVQSHISITFMTIGFLWVNSFTGTLDFNAIATYTSSVSPAVSFLLFLCFFIAFAIKAGMVPFHTWLPYAHPAAPSHVSGVMSGVIIKLGIYGILRMLLLMHGDILLTGYFILVISIITGIYGVMLALIQHNIKKLLAYHSIENIGIIGIGIGLGCIGSGMHNSYLAFAGFAGALLHTLNHSLFKSLLFFGAGTVYQATHTQDIERLGGLIKKMPQTASLFLVASLAICGLPPFNGFISEFLIYSGLFKGITDGELTYLAFFVAAIFGLVVIGGMAILCFTKAFGIIFLGTERRPLPHLVQEPEGSTLFPKYLIALFILAIGILPQFFVGLVLKPTSLLAGESLFQSTQIRLIPTLQMVSIAAGAFILLCLLILGIRKRVTQSAPVLVSPTWGCGYVAPTSRLQYTANSYVRSFRKLVRPLLLMNKKEGEIKAIFPLPIHSETHPYDRLEAVLIDIPVKHLRGFLGRFKFLQNG